MLLLARDNLSHTHTHTQTNYCIELTTRLTQCKAGYRCVVVAAVAAIDDYNGCFCVDAIVSGGRARCKICSTAKRTHSSLGTQSAANRLRISSAAAAAFAADILYHTTLPLLQLTARQVFVCLICAHRVRAHKRAEIGQLIDKAAVAAAAAAAAAFRPIAFAQRVRANIFAANAFISLPVCVRRRSLVVVAAS